MRIFKNKMIFKWAKSERLSDAALIKAVNEVELGQVEANLGGNLFKKRIARKGLGKSGGFRTIVVFQKGYRIFFVYGFKKNQRDNISVQEEKTLKKLAAVLLNMSDNRLEDMLINGDLYEVKT
jgi:hypothetical protein